MATVWICNSHGWFSLPAQLADGARLLAEFTENPNNRTFAAWSDWRTENCGAMLLRVAEVEECVREINAMLHEEYRWAAKRRRQKQETADRQFYYGRMTGFTIAMQEVRDLASRHNIDLSEPALAGEPTKGTP